MPVPFKRRLDAFLSYTFDTVCILFLFFSLAVGLLCVCLAVSGRMGLSEFAFRLVEIAVICGLGFNPLRNRLALWRDVNADAKTNERDAQTDFLGALLELNEHLWIAEERRRGNEPKWLPFATRTSVMCELQKTNDGVKAVEDGVADLSARERAHLISVFRRMWMALELRAQFLRDAANNGQCEKTYAIEHIKKSLMERDALVAAEIYVRTMQHAEYVSGTLAGLVYGYRMPTLREAMWKASNFSS